MRWSVSSRLDAAGRRRRPAREIALHDIHIALQTVHALDQGAQVLLLGVRVTRRTRQDGRGKRGAKDESADHGRRS